MRRARRTRPVLSPRSAFAGFRLPPEVIVLAIRWYLRFGLSYRDIEELLAERGVQVDHVTVFRWVQRLRRGHYELTADLPPNLRVSTAFNELAQAV